MPLFSRRMFVTRDVQAKGREMYDVRDAFAASILLQAEECELMKNLCVLEVTTSRSILKRGLQPLPARSLSSPAFLTSYNSTPFTPITFVFDFFILCALVYHTFSCTSYLVQVHVAPFLVRFHFQINFHLNLSLRTRINATGGCCRYYHHSCQAPTHSQN